MVRIRIRMTKATTIKERIRINSNNENKDKDNIVGSRGTLVFSKVERKTARRLRLKISGH